MKFRYPVNRPDKNQKQNKSQELVPLSLFDDGRMHVEKRFKVLFAELQLALQANVVVT